MRMIFSNQAVYLTSTAMDQVAAVRQAFPRNSLATGQAQ
jgi:hypothetical protein